MASSIEISSFLGVNNVDDPRRLVPQKNGIWLTKGENIDIDDMRMAKRRQGYGTATI